MVTLIVLFCLAWERFLRLRLRAVQALGFGVLWGAVWLLLTPVANPMRGVWAAMVAALLLAGLHSRYHRWFAALEDWLYDPEPTRYAQNLLLQGLANWRTRLAAMGLMGMGWPNISILIRISPNEKGVFRYQDGLGIVVDPLQEGE